MAYLKAPEGVTGVSLGAKEYPVVDGVFEVSDDEVDKFLSFGYAYGPAPEISNEDDDSNDETVAQREAELAEAQAALDAYPENEELKKAVTKAKAALTRAQNASAKQ